MVTHRKYLEELATLVGKKVEVECMDGKIYRGNLLAVSETLSVVLGDLAGVNEVYKLVISGTQVKEIRLVQRYFDLKSLAEKLSKLFPGNVTLREDIGAIIVMNRIKVTESGVVEGSGPVADRVRKIYEDYLREIRESQRH